MNYLDLEVLNRIDPKEYQSTKPFPFINFPGALYEEAYQRLVDTAPSDLSLFEKQFGIERKYGQKFHDKYYLEYSDALPLAQPWKEFAAELHSDAYRGFLEKLFDMRPGSYRIVLSWHYMPRGTCITPHCDTQNKIGSQLFYLNTSREWDETWGGQTLALDDEGHMDWRSGPQVSDFKNVYAGKCIDNNSFIFTRTDHSWHAVDEIRCPETEIRKMFSVVANRKPPLMKRIKKFVRKYVPV